MTMDSNEPNRETPFRIELGEAPPRSSGRSQVAHAVLEPRELPVTTGIEEEPESPSWRTVKKTVRRGFFDPFEAFEDKVDRERFRRSQIFLVVTSLVGPMLMTLVLGFLAALVYQAAAALSGFTPPNAFYELALYPIVYILAKGYWISYLVLPLAILVGGWAWAAVTAWNLTRDANREEFGKMFCILALLGAMYAPFTMFPFIRLVALGFLIWFVARRMTMYFDIPFFHLAKRGGLLLLILAAGYTWFERKVESSYATNSELSTNLNAIYNMRRKLDWPSFRAQKAVSPLQALMDNLGSLEPETREKATRSATAALNRAAEPPEDRFRLALRMAELGNSDGMVYLAKAYQSGQGVRADAAQSLAWIGKAVENNPKNLDYAMTMALTLIQNKRALDGKRMFVQLAKANLNELSRIGTFIRNAGLGAPETTLTWDIQNLYRQDATSSGSYSGMNTARNAYSNNGMRYTDDTSFRQVLLERLASLDRDRNQWFYRALISEYGSSATAEPETYGEAPVDLSSDEALKGVANDDPVALGQVGDQFADKGNVARAREYWLKSILAVKGDIRGRNARYYLKLAESFDPQGDSSKTAGASPRDAIRGYLGYLLLAESPGNMKIKVIDSLKRLGVSIDRDMNFSTGPFHALCAKHEVVEGLVMLGCDDMGGSVTGMPKNLAKARECFQRAKELGYQGPAIHMLDGDRTAAANAGR